MRALVLGCVLVAACTDGDNDPDGAGGAAGDTGGGGGGFGSPEPRGAGRGVFVWFDSAVWSATTDWFKASTCIEPVAGVDYLKPLTTILADEGGTGFKNLRALVIDNQSVVPMPTGAVLDNGNVFVIATSLDPTGTGEFLPWDELDVGGPPEGVPACFGSVDTAKAMTFEAFHSYVKQMLDPADPVPVSLMLSEYRTLRWGRLLSQSQHLDPVDGLYFGGLSELNSSPDAPNLAPPTAEAEALLKGRWSIHWPNNATTSRVDDVELVMNYVTRVIEFVGYANAQADLGPNPVLDIYLDLELFQLTQTAPAGNTTAPFGTQYPGVENIPDACLKSMEWWDPKADEAQIPTFWSVPANVADAFWRTLRQARAAIDAYNKTAGTNDVRLTLSVWSQEAYRFASPRFGILDTMVSANSWEQDDTKPGYGRFNQPFGTAQVKRRTGGTDAAPTYAASDWVCDCARIDAADGTGDASYQASPPIADDFTLNNCIFQFVDRVAYGTYQSVPASLVHPKATWKGAPFRNNTAVDIVGNPGSITPPPPAQAILPGQGVPLGGLEQNQAIKFATVATFVPTAAQVNDDGLLADGGWALYPPKSSGNPTGAFNPYYYNAMFAWPPSGAGANPDWTSFPETPHCDYYSGSYDMPFAGWLPFAARLLTNVDQWAKNHPTLTPPSIILTLEATPLDSEQAGSVGDDACFKNSYGSQWTWGDESGTTPCATGTTPAGYYAWPEFMVEPLCQADRVSYLFGGGASQKNKGNDDVIGNAWGLAAATRLFATTTGPSSKPLADRLDPQTPFAFNNHFSYHCLMTHDALGGFYTNPHGYGANSVTGERSCWNPWAEPRFTGCAAPVPFD